MKNSLIYFVGLTFFFIVVACETVVDIDIPFSRPKIVVNSHLIAYESVEVGLTFSRHVLDNAMDYEIIKNAKVIIKEGNQEFSLFYDAQNRLYTHATLKVSEGKTYTLRIEVPNYEPIEVVEKVPVAVKVDQFVYKGSTASTNDNLRHDFSVKFNDPVGPNYYLLKFYIKSTTSYVNQYGEEQLYIRFNKISLESKNPAYQDSYFWSEFLIDDKLFEGKDVDLEFYGSYLSLNENLEYFVSVSSVSKEFYLYNKTYYQQYYTSGDPFAQPVRVYSNIPNGLGVFKSSSEFLKKLDPFDIPNP
jgi:hypothetical protein